MDYSLVGYFRVHNFHRHCEYETQGKAHLDEASSLFNYFDFLKKCRPYLFEDVLDGRGIQEL